MISIALAGKGGTGKTTLAGLVVRVLRDMGGGTILAVDADPNATLHEALGVTVERSIGELTEDMLAEQAETAGMGKEQWLEYQMQAYLAEEQGFDLLTMGRPEGPGCYCYANSMVRSCIDRLSAGYDHVVIDNEAGLEHLSRRTTRNVDTLLLVTDPSVRGVNTAVRLDALADELDIGVGSRHLIVNRGTEPLEEALLAAAEGLCVACVVPDDPEITARDLEGTSVFEMDAAASSLAAIRDIMECAVPAPTTGGSV